MAAERLNEGTSVRHLRESVPVAKPDEKSGNFQGVKVTVEKPREDLGSFQTRMDNFENKMAALEKSVLDPLGCIPIVSSFSAAMRETISWIQGLAFLTFAAYFGYEAFNAKGDEKHNLEEKSVRCLNQVVHAVMNNGRSKVEAVPFFGNAAVVVYSYVLEERWKYENEADNPFKALFQEKYDQYSPMVKPVVEPYYNKAKATVDSFLKRDTTKAGA